MRALAAVASVVLAAAVTAAPASAASVEHHNVFDTFGSDVYDCDGIPAQDTYDTHMVVSATQRGGTGHPFPYYQELGQGTVVTTNLATGGTLTNRFSFTGHDHLITDNGDGTFTVMVYSSGSDLFYDSNGRLVLRETGSDRVAFDLDYHGTPSDPSDDTVVPDSFRILRSSTGLNDLEGRDFCADLRMFTTP
jgi:hypothetical protein